MAERTAHTLNNMKNETLILSPEDLLAARNWCKDCVWADCDPEDFDSLSDIAIQRGIKRFYDGGISQFQLDSKPL